MPRLVEYREITNMNLWDCIDLSDPVTQKALQSGLRLFGEGNIGDPTRCNMQLGNRISADHTAVMLSMYARTNGALDDLYHLSPEISRAWRAWTSTTVASLVVNGRPSDVTHPLQELLGPRVLGNLCGYQAARPEFSERLAAAAFERAQLRGGEGADARAWSDLAVAEQTTWIAAVEATPFSRPVIVPVRASFSVEVVTDQGALKELLRVLPATHPMMVWIHLAGVADRFTA